MKQSDEKLSAYEPQIDQISELSKSWSLFIIKQRITFASFRLFIRTRSVDTWWSHDVDSSWKPIENLYSLNSICKEWK